MARLAAGRRPRLGKHLSRPLRSHALVLRAGDSRWWAGEPVSWETLSEMRRAIFGKRESKRRDRAGVPVWDAQAMGVFGYDVRRLCEPIRIERPGVSIRDAAARFGVGVNTIKRWETKGLLVIRRFEGKHACRRIFPDSYYLPPGVEPDDTGEAEGASAPRSLSKHEDARMCPVVRRFPRMNVALVWTPWALDPGGEVWRMPWGQVRRHVAQLVPHEFSQTLVRVRRGIGAQRGMWQWICPGCGALVFKMYLAIRPWTAMHHLGADDGADRVARRFVCRSCAKLVYESAECTDAWDRFVQRLSGGMVRGSEIGERG